MEDLAAVEAYLRSGEYPSGINKGENPTKCRNKFKLEGGVLYYKKVGDESDESESWKICVQSDEKTKIIESHHAGVGGM